MRLRGIPEAAELICYRHQVFWDLRTTQLQLHPSQHISTTMAARISRHLPLLNRRGWASLPSAAAPRLVNTACRGLVTSRNTRNIAPWACRPTQARSVAVPLRYAHTDASSSAKPKAVIADATKFKGSNITEKHWTSQNLPVGTYARPRSGTLDLMIRFFIMTTLLTLEYISGPPN